MCARAAALLTHFRGFAAETVRASALKGGQRRANAIKRATRTWSEEDARETATDEIERQAAHTHSANRRTFRVRALLPSFRRRTYSIVKNALGCKTFSPNCAAFKESRNPWRRCTSA